MIITWTIRPGGLSEDDQDVIFAEAGRLSAWRIARRLGKHPSTVAWFLYRNGLKQRPVRRLLAPYMRNGALVRPFGEAEDAMLQALADDGLGLTAISDRLEARFGYRRSLHSLSVRLTMLASYDEAALDPPADRLVEAAHG